MDIKELYKLFTENYLVDTDTRKIRKGSLFFALKGANFNGNKFAEQALNNGASYAVIDESAYKLNDKMILVTNVLETLQKLANYHRNQLKIPIVGLTGSNGKTTTKELINAVLKEKYNVNATKGNLNNHIGVPLTLLSMDLKTEIGVVEMGANHHNEIALLSEITNPDIGYITNFGKAHLEGFGSVEGVVEAKSELYEFLQEHNKTAIVNPEDKIQMSKTNAIQRVLFDENINYIDTKPEVSLTYDGLSIKSNLIGTYNFNNIAAAITIGKYFEVSKEDIKYAIESYIPKNNRSQVIKRKQAKIILDAYNANPTSMAHALKSFYELEDDNKMVILGDMFELGKDSLKEHQNIVDLLSSYGFNNSILVGENFSKTKTNLKTCKSFDELSEHLFSKKITKETLLIKGSRGMALERVLEII